MNFFNFANLICFLALGVLLQSPALAIQTDSDQSSPNEQQATKLVQQGQKLYKNGDAKEAIKLIQKAVKLSPKNAEFRNQLATAYYHDGQMSQMWIELRKGALLDPTNPRIVQGLTTYWAVFDKEGIFNVGTPTAKVEGRLGTPDHRVTNRQDKNRTRLIYGFLALEFRNGLLHEMLDLRGLKPEHFQPIHYVDVELDGRGWRSNYRTNNQYSANSQWTLRGSRVQNWKELVSIQRLHNLGTRSTPLEEMVVGIMKNLKESNPTANFNILSKNDNSVLVEWTTEKSEHHPAQHEIARFFKAERDVHRVAYANKTESLNSETRKTWIQILQNAKLVKVGTTAGKQPAKVASNATDFQMWNFGRFVSAGVFGHARKSESVAKQNLVQAYRIARELNVEMPKPFKLTGKETADIATAIDYMLNKVPAALQSRLPEDKIAVYQLISRSFVLAMLADDEKSVESGMIGLQRDLDKSQLPKTLLAALKEKVSGGATPDQIRRIILKMHADVEI